MALADSITGTTSTSSGQALSTGAARAGTSTPQDIYNAFLQDASLGASILRIGEFLVVFGILLFALSFLFARLRSRAKTQEARHPLSRSAAYGMIALGIAIAGIGAYWKSDAARIPAIFSDANVSQAVWESYKRQYVEPSSGRTIDPTRRLSTTSEGESYTMLRAVWLDDQETFDHSWQWTRSHLERPDDHLFSWIYGRNADGAYGTLAELGGEHSASDADTDIALALVFAYARWQDPRYLADARQIADSIWNTEVVTINGRPYLAAGNVEKKIKKDTILVNPSYLAPYAYRLFARIDPTHPWDSLVDSSYGLLEESIVSPLDKNKSAGLPPDWLQIDRKTGAITALVSGVQTTNYSYDAMRAPWRIALDWKWYGDPRARRLLDRMSFLKTEWHKRGLLYASYGHDGSLRSTYEAPAVYGGSMGYFSVSDPREAADVYRERLLILFDPDTNTWRVPLSYYDANWVWFGMALYNDQLPNLARDLSGLSTNQ